MILACDALPCAAWLDGTTSGEERIEELLDLLIGKGAVALNIVPDRNWDIKDPVMRERKVQKLYEVVDLARQLDLPLNIGTEMNSFGQKLVDDFSAVALQPVRRGFPQRRLLHLRAYADAAAYWLGLSECVGREPTAHAPQPQ